MRRLFRVSVPSVASPVSYPRFRPFRSVRRFVVRRLPVRHAPSVSSPVSSRFVSCDRLELTLNCEISHFKIMAEQQEKLKKLFNARSNLESELCNIHKDITDAIDRQDRRVKVERLVSKLKDVFSKLVQKNEELFDLASKAENPDSIYPVLEQWFDDITNNNDIFLLAARSYIDSVAHRDTVCEGVNPQGQSKRSSRRTASSMSSQRKHDFLMAKLKREEAEKLPCASLNKNTKLP